jgi:hypothetical protein
VTPAGPPAVPLASPRPPRLAERALTWSLPAADREAVLGDLQEEFTAVATGSSRAAASRWYWTQTLTSVGPNVVRRIRFARERRRIEESDSDRFMREGVRALSLWLIGVPVALGLLAWFQDFDLSILILALPIFFIGLSMLIGSLVPRRAIGARTAAIRLRRWKFFWGANIVVGLPQLLLYPEHRHLLGEIRIAGLIVGFAIAVWPKEWRPIRPSWMPPEDPHAEDSR